MLSPGRTALVTGSATGICHLTARLLLEAGVDVAVNYLSREDAARRLAPVAESLGRKFLALPGDVSDPRVAENLVVTTAESFGRLDMVICGAGPYLSNLRVADTSPEAWDQMLAANLTAVYRSAHQALPLMRAQGWGRIITFGFERADIAPAWPDTGAYAAAKTGLVSLTRTLAAEEAPHGITVNMVCPGILRDPYKERRIAEVRGVTDPGSPMARPGCGEDVARVVLFLCDDDSDFLTGCVIEVNGGLFAWPSGPQ